MRQLQVTVPEDYKDDVEEILNGYSSDVSSSEAERDGDEVLEFTVTVDSDQIDGLTEDLKDVDGIGSGDLSIRVVRQESLIEKGQETEGSNSMLSQEEIYSKAKESSSFNRAQWSLIAISAIIASYGLVADNVIVVIGAMMLAPILSPFVSGALSMTVGDRRLLKKSLKTGLLSVLISILAAFVAVAPVSSVESSILNLVTTPTVYSVLLAVFVGSAAALTFTTGFRDQIAGVAVSIALIPPLAGIGIGLSTMDTRVALDALAVASMNMSAVLVAGFGTFRLVGLKPSTYYKKKQAEKIVYLVPVALVVFGSFAFYTANMTANSSEQVSLESEAEEFFGNKLLQTKVDDDRIVLYVLGDVESEAFRDKLSGEVEVEVMRLQERN